MIRVFPDRGMRATNLWRIYSGLRAAKLFFLRARRLQGIAVESVKISYFWQTGSQD
jgi:hypothetical protein